MLEKIMKENLLRRWNIMINDCVDGLLEQLKKRKKIKSIPIAPRQKSELIKIHFKKVPEVMKAIELYEFYKKIDNLRTIRASEFRKDVRLIIDDNGKETIINLDKLKEYAAILESFISYIKQFLQNK